MKWQGWGRMYYVHVYLPIEMWFLLFGVPFKKEQRILDLLLGKTSGQTVQLNDYRHLVSSKHKGKRSWYVLHILSQFHKPRESLQILADLHHSISVLTPQRNTFRHAFVNGALSWAFSYVRLVRGDMANSDCFDACGSGIRLFTSR